MTSREKRFIKFASVEYHGQLYMTPQDFLESFVDEQPRGIKNYKYLVNINLYGYSFFNYNKKIKSSLSKTIVLRISVDRNFFSNFPSYFKKYTAFYTFDFITYLLYFVGLTITYYALV